MGHNSITALAVLGTAMILWSLPYAVLADTCGVNFRTGYVGYITSPNYPSPYQNNQNCKWDLDVPTGDVIRLTFYPPFFLETNRDLLKIIEILPSGARLQTRALTGHTLPSDYTSATNKLELHFETDSSAAYQGFGLFWGRVAKSDMCGGEFHGTTDGGYITSPNYPSSYGNDQICRWSIQASRGDVIRLTFLTPFHLENKDSIKIFEKDNTSTTFTGAYNPPDYISESNAISLEFKSDSSGVGSGFGLSWEKLATSCNHAMEGRSGVISTDGYQSRYLGPECLWNILVPAEHLINLEINWDSGSDRIAKRQGPLYDDWVEVYDVFGNGSMILRGHWSRNSAITLQSFGSRLVIRLHSEEDLSGFQATWKAVSSCEGVMTAKEGYVMSHDFQGSASQPYDDITNASQPYDNITNASQPYGNVTICTWDISIPQHIDLHLSIVDFWNCSDVVDRQIFEILEYSDAKGRYVSNQDLCHDGITGNNMTSLANEVIAFNQSVRLVYRPSRDNSGGFFASWKSVCGKTLTSSHGTLNTPNYPRDYDADLECRWEIRTPASNQSTTTLRFAQPFDVMSVAVDECPYDYVEIFDTNKEGNMISQGRFCGSNPPPVMSSLTSPIVVIFHSDGDRNGQGFSLSWSSDPIDKCSGTFHAGEEGGYITSPNYPSPYGNNLQCDWLLNVTDGYLIRLTFSPPFQLERNSDFIQMTEIQSSGRRLTKVLTGYSMPPVYTSETNRIELSFRSDGAYGQKGFGVFWEKVAPTTPCSGSLGNDEGGYITSPNYPSPYDDNQRCNWFINVTAGDFIRLTFNPSFHLEQGYDFLKIFEIDQNSGRQVVRSLSGNSAPPVFTSQTNELELNFISDGSNAYTGFGFFWEKVALADLCGGYNSSLNDTGGYITSPNYPSSYGNNQRCEWVLDVPNGDYIRLIFNPSFQLQGNDYLHITDGGISSFTGSTVQPDYVSGASRVELLFTSNSQGVGKGFGLFWERVARAEMCGGNVHAGDQGGYITSPNYPHLYGNYMRCVWSLNVNANNLIRLTFHNPFDLESNEDFLKVYEVQPSGGRTLKRSLTGNSVPPVFTSQTNRLELEFTTDFSVFGAGFGVFWDAVAPPDVCSGEFHANDDGGYLTSPNYPSQYGNSQRCNWVLNVTDGDVIRLIFNPLFQLEKDQDFIKIFEIYPSGAREHTRSLTGNTFPPIYTSETNKLELQFSSDGSATDRGFGVFWEKVGTSCNHSLEGSSGVITTDAYQDKYVGPECWWNIEVPAEHFVHLKLNWTSDKGAEKSGPFYQDWLEAYDVFRNGSLKRRGRWYRSNAPVVLKSYGSRLAIQLHSEDVMANFYADWEAVTDCGGSVTAEDGFVMSYDYGIYPVARLGGKSCTWDIAIPQNLSITMNITHYFFTRRWKTCQVLKILEYSDDSGTFVPNEDWCPENSTSLLKKELTLSSQLMRLIYYPGNDDSDGFFASWKSTCGGDLFERKGTFSSPNYGLHYPTNLDCEWVIQGVKDHVIHLTFESPFDIESSNDDKCSSDYVEVLESTPGGTLVRYGLFCGTQTPPIIISTFSRVVVRFHSDDEKTGIGFSAMWDTACGDVYEASEGNLTSPRYPLQYPENFDCKWEIRVPAGYVIRLTFPAPFELEGTSRCDTDYLELYDYNTTGNLVKKGRWCGSDPPPLQSSMTSRMLVVFHSDGVKSYKGFQAQWDSVCGDVYYSPTGSFTSPGFPQPYPSNLNCRWEIHVAEGQRVRLEFGDTFDLEMDIHDCGYDAVEVLDPLSNGTTISNGRWCSVRRPPVVLSTSPQLMVIFKSDLDKSGQGFTATWNTVSGCGESYSSDNGYLLTPNFPQDYPEGEECHWLITPPDGTNVTLHFDALFEIELSNGCSWDYLQVRLENLYLGRWCGTSTPPDIHIKDGQNLEVIFKSDKSNSGHGFFASWTPEYW